MSPPPDSRPPPPGEDAAAWFRVAALGSLDPFFLLRSERDTEGRIVDFVFVDLNVRGETLLGLPRAQILGRRLRDLRPMSRAEGFLERYARVVETGVPLEEERVVPQPDGGVRWTYHQVVPLPDGIAITARNITRQKKLEHQLRDSLERLRLYADELEVTNRMLMDENVERLRAEEALTRQAEAIRALSTPILHAWRGVLALPLLGELTAARAAQILERLLDEIIRTQAGCAILDLTGVATLDPATAAHLLKIARAAALLGSRCLLSGVSPAAARTLLELGFEPGALQTFGQFQDALRHALKGERD